MGKHTNISWTEHTFNPWIGCTQVSSGCDNCYAMVLDKRWGKDSWGKGKPRRLTSDAYWQQPLRWDREAEKDGRKHLVFCASMADVMDDEAPEGARERLWKLIDATPNLIWQLLTKRPQRYERYLPAKFEHKNVWLGTTAENQENYNLRWPILIQAAEKYDLLSWISYEPAIGPLSLLNHPLWPRWIIFGGESGNNRRPCERQWADDLVKEINEYMPLCAFFMKQMGGRTPKDGKDAIPPELMIQQFPENLAA